MSRSPVLILVVVAVACSGGDAAYEEAAPYFERDRVLQVEITMAPADWDALRFQTRDIDEILSGADCLDRPFPDPFTYFPADVVIDGIPVTRVGVRKKGFIGSLDTDKPSLKIKWDEYVEGQGFSGLARMTLNNSIQDGSYANQCIAYDVFARAGTPAPRCSFARVSVNGDDKGVYVHIEDVRKPFLRHHFGSSGESHYEGTLTDFRPGWTGNFENKTDETATEKPDIDAIVAAAMVDDDELLPTLDELIDLDRFLSFWAVESLLRHWDGYAGNINNFHMVSVGGRFHFVPWGADQVLRDRNPVNDGGPTSVFANGILTYRLYEHPEGRQRYVAALRQALDTAWDEEALLAELDAIETLLGPHVDLQEVAPRIEARRQFIQMRRAQIEGELEAGPPDWPFGPRRPICR